MSIRSHGWSPPDLPRASVREAVSIHLARFGEAIFRVFDGLADGRTDHVALDFKPVPGQVPLVRVHSECATGDIFGSLRCDCGPQLTEALCRCSREGGIILYLRQEGRGIGLAAKIQAYGLQDKGLDTFAANRALGFPDDARDFRVAAQMLHALGHPRIRLLSNNPDKKVQLEQFGITVVGCERTVVSLTDHNRPYLAAKLDAGHALATTDAIKET